MSRGSIHPVAVLLISLVCACGPGCGERDETGPPTLHLGSDVCDFCKMIISDQNFAAACVVRTSDGRTRTAAFDDIGCLLAYQRALDGGTIEQRYVTDYDDGEWMNATQAYYIQSPEVRSPMASGIIASRTRAGADQLALRFKGSVYRYDQLGGHADPDVPANRQEETVSNHSQSIDTEPRGGAETTQEMSE